MYYESDFKNDTCTNGNCAEKGYCEECICSECGCRLYKWENKKCHKCSIKKEKE